MVPISSMIVQCTTRLVLGVVALGVSLEGLAWEPPWDVLRETRHEPA